MIRFSAYTYKGRCETHGIITNVSSVCRICEENDDMKSGRIKRPTTGQKKYPKKISCSNGKIMLEKYAYHRALLCLLVKHKCKILYVKLFWQTIIM